MSALRGGAEGAVERPVGFDSELAQAIEPLRLSLRQLLREVGSPDTPRVMQHRLGVPYVACWQAFRIARAADPVAEARHAPTPGMLKGLLAAATGHGAAGATVGAVAAAAADLRAFVKRHAGDRSTFDAMVAQSPADGRARTLLLQRRRTAYRAMSQIWGVQTDLQCMTSIYGPPGGGDPNSRIILMMGRGLRRLRADVPIRLVATQARTVDKADEQTMVPLDPVAAGQFEMSVLPAFSSPSINRIEQQVTPAGWYWHLLGGGDVGRRSSFEFVLGGLMPGTPQEITPDGRGLHTTNFAVMRRPMALLVIDVLLHRASFPDAIPQSLVHQYQEGDLTHATAESAPQFPGDEKVQSAGRADVLDLVDAPRYGELLRYAVGQKGWALSDFDAYRLRVPFPVLSTMARVFFTTR